MKIVVLDGQTTNPGDLSWAPLEALGDLTVYPTSTQDQVLARTAGADAVILNRLALDRPTLQALPQLKYVGMLATGYNAIDLEAAREQGIVVCNVPDYCTQIVAQQAITLLLALAGHPHRYTEMVRGGRWLEALTKNVWGAPGAFPLVELAGKKLGILGFGHIGQRVAKIAQALGMEILVSSRTKRELPQGMTWVTPPELFAQCDVVSLHCPLTPQTRHLVNEEMLARMKPTAVLINTARGAVVDGAALARALNEGRLAGAGLDVLEQEPPLPEDPLLSAKNCLITPHISWASLEARERLIAAVAENLAAFCRGTPLHQVN